METLIQELLKARQKKGMTQSELADKVGLPQGHISKIEHGKIDIRVSTLLEISRILGYEPLLVPRPLMSIITAIIEGKEGARHEPMWQPDEED